MKFNRKLSKYLKVHLHHTTVLPTEEREGERENYQAWFALEWMGPMGTM